MKRCKKCVATDTRPGMVFDDNGICHACKMFEYRKTIDFDTRWLELDDLCSKYRKRSKEYDMVIPISGGKDSHYQVHLFKEMFNMNPLGIMVDNFSWSETGRYNFNNISERFGIDIITFTPDRKKMKEQIKEDFINECWPNKLWDEILYRKPLEIAQKLGIGLVAWGENTSDTFGGNRTKDSPDAKLLMKDPQEFPDLEVIFASYYVDWSRFYNVDYSRKNGMKGFNEIEVWDRQGMEGWDYEQVDTIGYLVNNWLKFIKFGFSSQTELCSDAIRHGEMTRAEAIKRVNNDEWRLDPRMLEDFCEGIGISKDEFREVVIRHVNKDLIKEWDGVWRLKEDAK